MSTVRQYNTLNSQTQENKGTPMMQECQTCYHNEKRKNMMRRKNGQTNHFEMTFYSDGSRKLTGNI